METVESQPYCEDNVFRTIAKSVSWQAVGLVTTTGMAYAATGDLLTSSTLAVSSAVVGFSFYFLHERVWNLIPFGRRQKTTAA